MEVAFVIFQNTLPFWLILLALITGKYIEKQHYKSIKKREDENTARPAITLQHWGDAYQVEKAVLAQGSVVISIDYFKRFMAGLYNLVGGRVRSYESLVDRGRREALLRMKESCPDADIFVNLRLETCMLTYSTQRRQRLGGVEIIAYSTAIRYKHENSNEIRTEIAG